MGVRGETDNDGDYEAMIRRALERSDGLDALYSGYRALRSATVKEHRRPGPGHPAARRAPRRGTAAVLPGPSGLLAVASARVRSVPPSR